MGKFYVEDKIYKKEKELKKLKRKLSWKKRKARKIKLIKLGTLFLVTNLLDETQEKIVAHLENYKILSYKEKYELMLKGKEILKNREHIKYDENDMSIRKKMFYLMIRKSALLEKLKIHTEDPNIILGYLLLYNNFSEEQKNLLEKRGKEILKDKNKSGDNVISDEEKLKILKISIIHNVNITKFLKENYNTTIHNIKKFQFFDILKKLNINR